MYKYKFVTNCDFTLAFESKYHIDDLKPLSLADGDTFVEFLDSEILVNLKEIKDAEVNDVKFQIKTYAN
ncbi:hypothetical protein [Solibacillus sp. FSL K6-1523]|uniref:hypothetical protein n=1 Tax=Solibacillus sp. FSL K6-1523 TaxID=2921471 RepID=UPI0030FCA1A3